MAASYGRCVTGVKELIQLFGRKRKGNSLATARVTKQANKKKVKHGKRSGQIDAIVRKVFSVPHEEIVKREKEYKRQRAKKKRAKISPASRASYGKD